MDYANGKIYKLVNNVDAEFYVGSTTSTLSRRLHFHKHHQVKNKKTRVYQHLDEIGWDNVDIVLVENYPCESKIELHQRERYWIETLKSSLNMAIPTRTHKEWLEVNKEHVKDYKKKYNTDNAEAVKQYRKKRYDENHERMLEEAKRYREANKERRKAYMKEYREKNKEAIKKKTEEYRHKHPEKVKKWKHDEYLRKKEQVKDVDIMA